MGYILVAKEIGKKVKLLDIEVEFLAYLKHVVEAVSGGSVRWYLNDAFRSGWPTNQWAGLFPDSLLRPLSSSPGD